MLEASVTILHAKWLRDKWSFPVESRIIVIKGFRTIVFIFIVISTTFRPICPPAFFIFIFFFFLISNLLTGKSSSYVKNSAHLVERICDALIQSNQMVSLDVVSLFTKVPTDETLTVWGKLATDPLLEEHTCIMIDNLMEMLTFYVVTTYFVMGTDIYQQEGLAMDSPLSPVLANIYMEYFEEMALGSTSLKPSM